MSRALNAWEYSGRDFELGDIIEFDNPYSSARLQGEVVRVYNTRTVYHVMVDSMRFEVTTSDNLKLIRKA